MSDNNIIIAIIIIITVLIVAILLVIPIGENNNDVANVTNLIEKTQNKIRTGNYTIIGRNEVITEENVTVMKRFINTSKYKIDEKYGDIAKIYNDAMDKIFASDSVAEYGYVNGQLVVTGKIDFNKTIGYFKIGSDNAYSEMYVFFDESKNMLCENTKVSNSTTWGGSGKTSTQMETLNKIVDYFLSFSFNVEGNDNAFNVGDFLYQLEKDAVIDGHECNRIISKYNNDKINFSSEIYIEKSTNAIIRIDKHIGEDTNTQYYTYNSDSLTIPEEVLKTWER